MPRLAPTMPSLSLAPILECPEEYIPTPSGETPTGKRQRRLTLTAMTGLICELSKECPKGTVEGVPRGNAAETVPEQSEDVCRGQRLPSPLKRLKRCRASISATATADVMLAHAAKSLGNKLQSKSSDSSDSTEEEESIVSRVRRAQAFECGASAVTEPAKDCMAPMPGHKPMAPMPGHKPPGPSLPSPGRQQGALSPRSKLAFERGARAAQVAAKVAAAMMPSSGVIQTSSPTSPASLGAANRAAH